MKGIIYTRVSSDEQVKGTSLEFQEDLCRKYADQKDIEIVEVFREEGESAKNLSLNNRKKFLEALEFCRNKKNQIESFIVLRVDRFARNTEDHFSVRKILLGYGTTLHSVTEPIGNKPAEKFIETVLAGAAEYDNAIRKQRCTDGMISRFKQGIYPFQPPIGYLSLKAKKHGEKKSLPDPIDEKRFFIIQKGLKEFATGLYTQANLVEMFNKWGLTTVQNKKIRLQLIDRMLGKYLPFYAGILINPWTGEESEGQHKSMISTEEMKRIQLIRKGKFKKTNLIRLKDHPLFPLRRVVKCGECLFPLTGSSSKGRNKTYAYYHCHNKSCSMLGKAIPKLKLEEEFIKHLKSVTPSKKFLKTFGDTVLAAWNENNKDDIESLERFETQLRILEEKKNRIYEMREDGSYSKEEFIERKGTVESEIFRLQADIRLLKLEKPNIEELLDYAVNTITKLSEIWLISLAPARNRFQQLVFPEGIPYYINNGFGTAKLGHIYSLNQQFRGQKSQMVHHSRLSWNRTLLELQAYQELLTPDVEEDMGFLLAA